ncbi:MAG: iron-containing alcohol dehydrogenase [Pseudomonadota bacterium]|jgi:alcohol dehydrogenase class IV|nr:iron-containing alcohol dehydrogenase [Pseudomonadota bacterium]QKK04183.1 MAG: iron-containing alcohol dehydrogenase [Pseudomonadota bacterium]
MSKTLSGNWNYPTKTIFGEGLLAKLPQLCRDLNIGKPLLVTDEGLAESDIVKTALKINADAGMTTALFTKVKGNPTGKNVTDGTAYYKEQHCDGVIAFGGGSGLDAGKAIALMAGQNRPLWDFEDVGDNWTRVNADGIAPIIAIPTTAGTGSEVGRASVITKEDTHEKKIIFHPKMLPDVVIADPALTIGLPPHLTAATGLDAFIHSFEAFCAPGYHPMADGIALEGMRLISLNLPRAYMNGKDVEARANMLAASMMGAAAFQKGLGGVHALAHPLGAVYDKHHGLLNAILLPYVMIRNRDAINGKMELLARFLNLPGTHGFDAVLDWVMRIRESLGIPHSLSEIGIKTGDAAKIGAMALADPSSGGNPLPLKAKDYAALFDAARRGDLDSAKIAA